MGDWLSRFDALVLLTTQPETILGRLRNDSERERSLFLIDMTDVEKITLLNNYISQTISEFEYLAKHFKLPSIIIYNEDNKLPEAIGKFIQFNSDLIRSEQ